MRFDVFFAENTNKEVTEKEVKKLLASKNPEYAYSSAYIGRDTYKKYKDLFEAKILESPYWTVKYVTDVLNGIRAVTHKPHNRWPKGESVIAKDPYASWLYARYIIYGRWPEGEKAIFDSEDPQYKDIYLDFLNSIGYQDEDNQELSFESFFNEDEGDEEQEGDVITRPLFEEEGNVDLDKCIKYAIKEGKRWPELEKFIIDYKYFYRGIVYAEHVLKGRWLELERLLDDTKHFTATSAFKAQYLDMLKDIGYEDEDNEEQDEDVITRPLYDEEGYVDLDKCVKYAIKEGKRWPELENLLISHHYFNSAIRYAKGVLKGRWLELEEILNSENYSTASDFKAQYLDMLKDLGYEDEDNEEQEDVITRDLITARYGSGKEAIALDDCIDYAAKIGKRWPKLEQYIIYTHFPGHGIDYAKRVLKGRWVELENFLQKYYDEGSHYRDEYLEMLKDLNYEDEDNEEKESTKPLSPGEAYTLAKKLHEKDPSIKRFPDLEKIIVTNSYYSTRYAEEILGERWPEAEPLIATAPYSAYAYAMNVIKGRWPEGEPAMFKTHYKNNYLDFLHEIGYQDEDNEEQDVIDKPLFLTPGTNGVLVVDDYRCLKYAVEQGKRWPEFEKHIIHSAKLATGVQYAKDVIKGRWPALEVLLKPLPYLQNIYIRYLNDIGYEDEDNEELSFESFFSENIQTPTSAVEVYTLAKELGERLPEYEHIIINDKSPDAPAYAYMYLKKIINKNAAADQDRVTWPEAEPLLAKDADTAYRYALYYINAKYWDDEDYDTKPLVRFPLGEPEIAKDAYSASRYARNILRDRFPEGEKAIAKDEYEMKQYVKFLNQIGYEDEDNEELSFESFFTEAKSKVRPPTQEELTEPNKAYFYARDVLHGRFPEGEKAILDDPTLNWTINYVVDIVKSRWPEAEPAIFCDPDITDMYMQFLNDIGYQDEDNEEL